MTDPKALNVLIVEDMLPIAKMLKTALHANPSYSFEIEILDKLAPALERIEKGGIDVVVLDLGLPDSSGYDTFEKIQTRFPHMPIVVITGDADESLATKIIENGAQDYLVKGQLDTLASARVIYFAYQRKQKNSANS